MKYMVLIAKHHDGFAQFDSKLYLHVYQWPRTGLAFDALPYKVLAARTLTGAPATFQQSATELAVDVAAADRDTPVTVIELTLDQAVQPGRIIGVAHEPKTGSGRSEDF